MQTVGGLLATIEGVEVAAAAKDEGIDMVEGIDEGVGICHGRDDDGYTSCCHHRLVIALAQFTGQVFVVAGDTDDGLSLGGRIFGIDVAKMGLQVESVCHSGCCL